MKLSSAGVIGLVLGSGAVSFGPASAANYRIDPTHVSIIFRVGHWHFSKVQGQFRRITGRFTFDPRKPEASKVYVEVDTRSFDTNHKARDAHMRGPEFFNTARFPRAIFRSTKIRRTGKRTGLLIGNLTLLGVTRPVTLRVTFNGIAPHPLGKKVKQYRGVIIAGFSARASIRRSLFGMTHDIPGKSDVAELIIEVEGWRVPRKR
jgi:polyisoprenoid-binding protein YceI